MKILADSSLPCLANFFPKPFELNLYSQLDDVTNLLNDHDILLCRSTLKVTETLLKKQHSLRYIATASSGTDHIDEHYLRLQGIKLLNAKGSNALAVADYVLACIAFLQQHTNFRGKQAGIIGLGAVGTKVAHYLKAINFDIICYDPPKQAQDSRFKSCLLTDIMTCDVICIHANLHDNAPYPSRRLLTERELALIKPNAAIINASRGDIVLESALLNLTTPIFYCTDVFLNEPEVNEQIINLSSLCTPHIAGHSVEAKIAAVRIISEKLHSCYQLLPNYDSNLSISQQPNRVITPNLYSQQLDFKDILSLYNPIHETRQLKKASKKKDAFLQLRQAHRNRHHFNLIAVE